MGEKARAAPSHKIEAMPYTDLNQLMANGKGNHCLFFTAAWCGH